MGKVWSMDFQGRSRLVRITKIIWSLTSKSVVLVNQSHQIIQDAQKMALNGWPRCDSQGKMNLNGPLHQVCILNFLILTRWRNIATNKDQYMSVRFCNFQRFSCEFSLPPKCSFWMPWQYRSHFFGMRKFCRSSQLREHLLRCAKTVQFLLGVIKPQVGMGWREVLFWLNFFFFGVSTKKM